MATVSASLFVYDIPDVSNFPNPSALLRRFAFHLQLSCWIVPNDRIPYRLMDAMNRAGVKNEIIEFAGNQAEKLVRLAAEAIRMEIVGAVSAARECEAEARRKADAGGVRRFTTKDGRNLATSDRAAYWKRVRASVSRAKRLMKDAKLAAAAFKMDPEGFDFFQALQEVSAISASAKIRAHIYARLPKVVEQVDGPQAAGIAATLRAEVNPNTAALVAADYLEENGETVLAEETRSVFSH